MPNSALRAHSLPHMYHTRTIGYRGSVISYAVLVSCVLCLVSCLETEKVKVVENMEMLVRCKKCYTY